MYFTRTFLLLLTGFIFLLNFQVFSQSDSIADWKLAKEKKGIQVYTRFMEGEKFKEYKTIAEVDASAEELINILLDVASYSKWMAHVKLAEILEMDGDDRFYVYSEVSLPWPFDNRDEVTLSVISRDEVSKEIQIEISIIPDYIPEKKGIVRMPSGKGLWVFTPHESGKTQVYHQFGGDPGGNIPAWIVNMFLVDGPYKTMLSLQEVVAKKSYKKKK